MKVSQREDLKEKQRRKDEGEPEDSADEKSANEGDADEDDDLFGDSMDIS